MKKTNQTKEAIWELLSQYFSKTAKLLMCIFFFFPMKVSENICSSHWLIGLISLETFIQKRRRKSYVKFVFRMSFSKEKVTDGIWHLGWVKGNQAKKWTLHDALAQRSNGSCVNRWDKLDKNRSAENQRRYELLTSVKVKRQSTRREAIKPGEKAREGVIIQVQGEQDSTDETNSIKGRKDMRTKESGEDFWRYNQWECITVDCCWNVKSKVDFGEKEHEEVLLDKVSKEARN